MRLAFLIRLNTLQRAHALVCCAPLPDAHWICVLLLLLLCSARVHCTGPYEASGWVSGSMGLIKRLFQGAESKGGRAGR